MRQGNGISPVWTLSCNSSPPVCANLFSHSEHEKCFQLNDFMFALFTRVWFLSCTCFSVLLNGWICCCIVHKGKVPFCPNLLWHVGQGNGFSSVWTLSCNSSPLVCANFFSHSEHEKCCQLNDFMFALFTRVWFLSCVCFSVLLIHWILCSIVILTKNIHHFISFLTDSRNLFKKSVH